VPLPYRFVWSAAAPAVLTTAVAHVHLSVSLPGFTPGLPEVFGVPLQLSNFAPPGVCFDVESADWLVSDEAVLCGLDDVEVDVEAEADADDDSSAFFA
jgi:hypothetical protein